MLDGDDDRTLRLIKNEIIPALTPTKFVVTIEVEAISPFDIIHSLLQQYRNIKDIPATEATQAEIVDEIRDFASTLENLPTLITQDINNIFETDEAFYPSTTEAKLLGIKIEWATSVTDS